MSEKEMLVEKMEEINAKNIADLNTKVKSLEIGMSRVMGEYGQITGNFVAIKAQLERLGNKCFVCFGAGKIFIHDDKKVLVAERECGRCRGTGLIMRVP